MNDCLLCTNQFNYINDFMKDKVTAFASTMQV
jgi:hypothetical protein